MLWSCPTFPWLDCSRWFWIHYLVFSRQEQKTNSSRRSQGWIETKVLYFNFIKFIHNFPLKKRITEQWEGGTVGLLLRFWAPRGLLFMFWRCRWLLILKFLALLIWLLTGCSQQNIRRLKMRKKQKSPLGSMMDLLRACEWGRSGVFFL